jgi:hypothetical protein
MAKAMGHIPRSSRKLSPAQYVNLKVLVWGKEAWDEGSVSEKPATVPEQDFRYWEWPPRD